MSLFIIQKFEPNPPSPSLFSTLSYLLLRQFPQIQLAKVQLDLLSLMTNHKFYYQIFGNNEQAS